MAYKGSDAILKMGSGSAEASALTLASPDYNKPEDGHGCGNPSITDTNPSRVRPGGTTVKREGLGRSNLSGSFECDANPETTPLLAEAAGKRFNFWWYPEGAATGKVKESFAAFVTAMTITFSANGVVRFSVTLMGDSAVTKTTI